MEDRELILKYRVGDDYALEVLLKQNKPLINQIARKYFLIGAEIDDLIQEGMIGLYRAVTTFDATKENSFKSYARVCIERAVINAIKSANSKKNLPLNQSISLSLNSSGCDDDDEDDVVAYVTWDNNDPESILLSRENYKKLFEKATQNLSVFEQNVLKLYLEGLSYSEIAEKLDKNEKSIDNGLTRIKTKISIDGLEE